ncbi:AraC family transcriptional regulator [Ideonella sp. DXS29W]|uniref:AraC family transcriptional regulator n=1 Tax=Ideonella lacteola TaxID=2984193 RepID=A0ABU9BWX7_9BURK
MRIETSSSACAERINRAIDHVVTHLNGPLRLEDVAAAAHVSPFHFHRLFKATLGENLAQFIKRQRLERALYLMSHEPATRLTDVALRCGFASSSDFSRSFRQRYGLPPSAFDLEAFRQSRREEFERILNPGRAVDASYFLAPGENPDGFEVTLRDLPPRTVAYIRVLAPHRPGAVQAACERLMRWADERGLGGGSWLGYMWDEPEIVALKDCRYDAAVVADGSFAPVGGVARFDFPAMRVAEVIVRGDLALEARAFDWLYRTWLPHSGYLPDDHPTFEAWIGRPYAHGAEHVEIACQLPVRRA